MRSMLRGHVTTNGSEVPPFLFSLLAFYLPLPLLLARGIAGGSRVGSSRARLPSPSFQLPPSPRHNRGLRQPRPYHAMSTTFIARPSVGVPLDKRQPLPSWPQDPQLRQGSREPCWLVPQLPPPPQPFSAQPVADFKRRREAMRPCQMT